MNIYSEIKFNPLKPATLSISNSAILNIFAVGLVKGQVLAKHKTSVPALLTVLKGEILFHINSMDLKFSEMDTYQIPVNEEHEVIGIAQENVFMIVKEKML